MKIGFLAYTTKTLEIYWNRLHQRSDCWWGVTRPHIYDLLKEKNISNVVYHYDKHVIDPNKAFGNKFVSENPGQSERVIAQTIDPDIWIAEYPNNLIHVPKRAFWIQAFSSLPIKKYFFHPPLLEYGLLLIPGEYHKKEMIKRLNFKRQDEKRLKVVGWPRVDCLINQAFDRENIMSKLGLDTNSKTIMYAPTWGWGYGNDTFFARWFGREKEVFEQLCKKVKENNLNFIVKLHGLSFQTTNKELIDIARKYGVLWLTNEVDRFTEDPNPYLWITDVLISDLSGIIAEFLTLNRPIIYIDPDEKLDAWNGSDMPRSFRAGHVVRTPEELFIAIDDSIITPQRFQKQREELVANIFYSLDGKATDRAVDAILDFAYEKGLK